MTTVHEHWVVDEHFDSGCKIRHNFTKEKNARECFKDRAINGSAMRVELIMQTINESVDRSIERG